MGAGPSTFVFTTYEWQGLQRVGVMSWRCAYCGDFVSSDRGWLTNGSGYFACPCPRCRGITMFQQGEAIPSPVPGNSVSGGPPNVADLYDEARRASGAGAHTASVMACRKLLMNIAVAEGAREGLGFKEYVEYLEKKGMFSPKAKTFVEYIKDLGNEANHQIAPKGREDAEAVLEFVGSLIRHNYEVPAKVPKPGSASTESDT